MLKQELNSAGLSLKITNTISNRTSRFWKRLDRNKTLKLTWMIIHDYDYIVYYSDMTINIIIAITTIF